MEALSAPTSSLYIGLHGLFAVFLANFVLYIRLRSDKVPDWQPDAVLRVQANFVENVPLALLLLFLIDVQGAPSEFIHLFGSALFLSRAAGPSLFVNRNQATGTLVEFKATNLPLFIIAILSHISDASFR